MLGNIFKKEKSLSELEEDNERLQLESQRADYEFTITEKKAMAKKLREEYGLNPKYFGFNWSAIKQWLRTH